MTVYATSGSGIERHMECAASGVLPRVWYESSADALRGTAIHDHLERLALGVPLEESLGQVPEDFRDAAAASDVDALADDLKLTPEVALAYRPADDTARVLGTGLRRDYSTVTAEEFPGTIDLAGLRAGRGVVRDYKTGARFVTRTRRNWQMLGAALSVSRAFQVDEVEAEIIYVREHAAPIRDRAEFSGLDLAGAAAELRASLDRLAVDRERYARGEHVEPTEGAWCQYCPSRWACPAKVGMVRNVLEIASRREPIPASALVRTLELLRAGRREVERLERQLEKALTAEPLLIESRPDGVQTWVGAYQVEGREVLDLEIAATIAAEVLKIDGAEARAALAPPLPAASKERIRELVAAKVRHGTIDPTVEKILAAVRRAGGARRPPSTRVGEFTVQAEPAPSFTLPAEVA